MNLTCSVCRRHIATSLARWTELGYKHADARTCLGDPAATWHRPAYNAWQAERDRMTSAARTAALIEDAEWLAAVGEGLTQATRRLGYRDHETLRRTLSRAGRIDLYRAFADREGEWNAPGRHGRKVA